MTKHNDWHTSLSEKYVGFEWIAPDRTRWLCRELSPRTETQEATWQITHQDRIVWEALETTLPPFTQIEAHHTGTPVYSLDLSGRYPAFVFPDGRRRDAF